MEEEEERRSVQVRDSDGALTASKTQMLEIATLALSTGEAPRDAV